MSNSFPCSSCGLCCKSLKNNPLATDLDRGDGICRHLDIKTNLCQIYSERPLICRVEDFYYQNLKDKISWEEFVNFNVQACKDLQSNQVILKTE